MARVKSHHAKAPVRPLVHHGMDPGNRFAVDVGEQQGVHASFRAPRHGFVAVAVKRGLIEVGMGVNESHGAKL